VLGGFGGPSHIEIWEIENGGKLGAFVIISLGFTNSVKSLDWSTDSGYIAASSESFELKFVSVYK
jgi:WD40 repeat protein